MATNVHKTINMEQANLINSTALNPALQMIKTTGQPGALPAVLTTRFQCGTSVLRYDVAVCVMSLQSAKCCSGQHMQISKLQNNKNYLKVDKEFNC